MNLSSENNIKYKRYACKLANAGLKTRLGIDNYYMKDLYTSSREQQRQDKTRQDKTRQEKMPEGGVYM